MGRDRVVRGTDIEEDLQHQILEWKIERVGWVIWALVLLAGLAGLLGGGPLTESIAGDRTSALWVEYQRFERYQAPTKMVVHVKSPDPQIRLWINYGFVTKVDLTHIDPEPERSEVGANRYTFPANITDKNQDVVLTVYFRANEYGMMHTELGLENGPSVRFSQLVYP